MSFVVEQGSSGLDLILTGDWTVAARAAIDAGRADGLVLNYARGFREQPIDFIRGLPIRRLDVLARSVDDLTPVHSLATTLEELRVQSDPRAEIDLASLPLLRTLAAPWPQVRRSIRHASHVGHLAVPSYAEADLHPLADLTSLTSLVMKQQPRLQSLDGIEALPWLAHLGVHGAPGLTAIDALAASRPTTLQVLQLQACRQIVDVAPVAAHESLQFLDLSEGGEIRSVAPLGGLSTLERLYLYGSTRITDGDLRPILDLPRLTDLRIQSRRHYSPAVKQVQDAIARRG